MRKLPLILGLGAAVAPAQYLVVGVTVSRHVDPVGRATVLALVDMSGYLGTILLLRAASTLSDGVEVAGVSPALALCCAATALICFISVAAVYLQEMALERSQRKRQ